MPLSEGGRSLRDRLFTQREEAAHETEAEEEKAALRQRPGEYNVMAGIARLAPVLEKSIERFGKFFVGATIEAFEAEGSTLTELDAKELANELTEVVLSHSRGARAALERRALVTGMDTGAFMTRLSRAESTVLHKLTNEIEIYRLKKGMSGKDSPPSLEPRDSLTQLLPRPALDRDLALAFSSATALAPLAVIFSDLDHFKSINDEFSHATGDAVLRAVAACFLEVCGARCDAYRYGGEEFVVLLKATSAAEAHIWAERLRSAVESLVIPSVERTITVSLGIATTEAAPASAEDLLSRADAAMYKAKTAGRNRVVLSD